MRLKKDFGVYIKTHWRDYHLARASIWSLRKQFPELSITIIPDDGYHKGTIFGEPVIECPDPRLQAWKGFYKKLWCFYGNYERFLYIDADVMAIRPLGELLGILLDASREVMFVNGQSKFLRVERDSDPAEWRKICSHHIGDIDLIRELDPELDMEDYYPFNTGFMYSSRASVPLDTLFQWYENAQEFQVKCGFPQLGYTRKGVFMSDQGFINYFARKAGLDVRLLRDVYVWGSEILSEDDILTSEDPLKYNFVHWAGSDCPSLWCRDMLFHEDWKKNFSSQCRHQFGVGGMFANMSQAALYEILRRGRRFTAKIAGKQLDRDGSKRLRG